MRVFTEVITAALARASGLDSGDIRLESPRDPGLGDFAFPCFPLAKTLRKAPPAIATDLAAQLQDMVDIECVATGPYLNFRVNRGRLAETILTEIDAAGSRYGTSEVGRGKTIVIDLSSPNIAKPMSVGHLRSTVIGAAIQRLHTALGYETVGINHIGDWGSQFGKLVAAIDRWGDTVDLDADPIRALLALYVRYHEEEEDDPELSEAAKEAFRELESGKDGKVRATWKRLTELSLREFDKIYARLGVTFDVVRGEAFYEDHLQATIDRIVEAGVTEESDGALVVSLEKFDKKLPPCLLRKSDGTTLYATRDLAAAFHRWELYNFERALYVVGSEQKLHFRQLKLVLERMGLEWEEKMEHIAFGLMRLPEGKMSTRKGRVVFLDDVLDRATEGALAVIREKNPDIEDPDGVAQAVGVGAVIFNDLKRERIKDVEFVLEEVISPDGDTGPYLQYTHARSASILRKLGKVDAAPDWSVLENAGPLLLRLGRYPDTILAAAQHAEPSELSSYLLGLARELNSWLHENRVLGQPGPVQAARASLVRSCKSVICSGLEILGLQALEQM